MSQSERSKRYAASEKGKAVIERKREREKAKRGAGSQRTEAKSEENVPAFGYTRTDIRSRESAIEEANARVFDNHMANERRGMAIESLCRSLRERVDRIENDLKPIRNDQRTTEEEWAPIAEALTRTANRWRMMARWMSKNETLEERKLRLAHGMFLDEGDPDFLKELLLGKPSS
jgi:hypothetical protein